MDKNHIPFWLQDAFAERGNADGSKYGAGPGEPWCSLFLKWVFAQTFQPDLSGVTAMARSWLGWGVPLDSPRVGCITVYSRAEAGPEAGHVDLWLDCHHGWIYGYGGNQSGAVCISTYSVQRVLGYRWPAALAGELI